jgi:hypothetical protein
MTDRERARLTKRIARNNFYLRGLAWAQRQLSVVGIEVDLREPTARIQADTEAAELALGGLDQGEDWLTRWD